VRVPGFVLKLELVLALVFALAFVLVPGLLLEDPPVPVPTPAKVSVPMLPLARTSVHVAKPSSAQDQ
jgi:hypothetical protein